MVLHVEANLLRLRYTERCSSCSGCAGRCSLFLADAAEVLELRPPARGQSWSVGDAVEVELPSRLLLRQAWLGYGLPLLGMLVGAALATPWGNPAAALGALAGTLLAVRVSNRAAKRLPEPRLRRAATAPRATS